MTVLPVLDARFLIGLNTLQWYMVVRVGGVMLPLGLDDCSFVLDSILPRR